MKGSYHISSSKILCNFETLQTRCRDVCMEAATLLVPKFHVVQFSTVVFCCDLGDFLSVLLRSAIDANACTSTQMVVGIGSLEDWWEGYF